MADFVRRSELWTYDVFPKVIGTEKESTRRALYISAPSAAITFSPQAACMRQR